MVEDARLRALSQRGKPVSSNLTLLIKCVTVVKWSKTRDLESRNVGFTLRFESGQSHRVCTQLVEGA